MAACLRHARRHRGLTGNNPAVGTLLVRNGIVVGRGVTARGGRPHAEPVALATAGTDATGATAYVTLEPCAHHGATPPCAQALIDGKVARVVTAWTDPDNRVDGKGHAMLQQAGIDVETDLLASEAAADLAGYLNRKQNNRPQVILKLAISPDGKLGIAGKEIPITGPLARAYAHRMRAEADGILVGRATAEADDPDLTCRLPGLAVRSPHRFVLDSSARLSVESRLAASANVVPVSVITARPQLPDALGDAGVRHFVAERHNDQLALPEVLEDMAALGISSLMVEGGAGVAASMLDQDLVDEIALFTGANPVGGAGIPSPVTTSTVPAQFSLVRALSLGEDTLHLYRRHK